METLRILIFFVLVFCFFAITNRTLAAEQVVINEFLPAPSQGNSEWVEFYASESADLSDYYFDDDTDFNSDSGTSGKIALSGILSAKATCYWELPTYLNNNGDKPTLFKIDGTVVDTYSYSSTQTDKSYSRVPDGETWQVNVVPIKSSVKCIDLAPAPTPTPIASSTPMPVTPLPLIEFTVPAGANLGESFKTMVNLKNFAANTEFYLKIRDKVQTKNGNNFLSDNEAWNFFPLIKTDSSGNWSGEIWGMISEDKDAGIYKIKLRVRKKDTDSFFESDIKEVKLSKIITPVVVVATPSAKLKIENSVLGTKSASVSSLPEQPKEKEKTKFDRLSLIILISGGIFSLAGIYGIIKHAL